MPAVSEAQRRLMFAARSNPEVAKRTGVPQSVAREFAAADKGGKLPAHVKNGKPMKARKFGSLG